LNILRYQTNTHASRSTESCYAISSGGLGFSVNGTLYDINIQNYVYGTDGSQWLKIKTENDSISTLNNSNAASQSRQMLSSETFGLCKNSNSYQFKYDYNTESASQVGNSFATGSCTAGMVKDDKSGYWIGYTDRNYRIDYNTFSQTKINSYTIHFGESNTLGTEKYGYAMGGYYHNGHLEQKREE